ncbi:MAG: SbcC-like subunit of palindrome specific endonuclease [phage Lak_Megaphage_RVC_AP4_GC26]|uniref:SbcC-like subunit of palindrome specific endonuclease n=1 Tax=phage Lak_Megaphage_RVC_AP3_GC26 TaxID=3109225 RepID=A0ABZ0YZN1_9CAUD|nr:MAG: SbcC-like subunit of palindrome specific endonuclease [phage Lak_Megaphage_RVC_AP3_GC26]WQJ52199.1 MAG: SbcC-like subunit of palindrome specific endonuclease [phage Lak_Megaphage_RVC_AP4_GC26]
MKIEKIEFRNLFSYGEQVQEINYDDTGKLILLKGQSGAGKSAILSLPCLLLYGKIEKVPKTSIANRINKNGWMRGTIKQGQHTYVIERKFSPNGVTVFKDNENIENYGTKDAQSFIDSEIIDIPQATYSNMISISMKSFKSFLKMSPADRKQIIDRVFDLEIINVVFENLKKDMRELGSSINADNSTIFSLNQTIQNANNELIQIQQKIQSKESKDKIEENNNKIQEDNQKLKTLNDGYNQYVQKQQEITNQFNSIKNQQIENSINIRQIQEKINLFKQEKCPTCGCSFSSEQFNELRENLNKLMQDKMNIDTQLQGQMKTLTDNSKIVSDYLNKIASAVTKINQSINALNSENLVIQEKLKSNSEYKAVQNIIEKTTDQLNVIKKNIEDKNQQMLDLQNLSLVYSIDGVKQKVINNYLPLLNKEIEDNLIQLNIPYGLEFDSKFDPHLKDLGNELDPVTLSDGEMTRVDIVVLCSLFKLLKRRYPSINTFTLDEVISTLDNSNSGAVLEFLKNFAKDNKLNCFVVSHTDLYLENFDEIIEVEKHNGFSRFTVMLTSQ